MSEDLQQISIHCEEKALQHKIIQVNFPQIIKSTTDKDLIFLFCSC